MNTNYPENSLDRAPHPSNVIYTTPVRRVYTSPTLEILGNVRDLTLGGTTGDIESGSTRWTGIIP